MLIIDCHCHAGRGDGLTGPWDTDAPLTDYLQWADEAGIQRTVLFAAFHSDYAAANRHVARLVQQQPERFYGFAFVHAQRDRGRVLELVGTAVQQYGFVGIKCHRYDARLSREICDVARAFRLPVLYDVVGEISAVELLGEQYPDVNFIIPHLGSFSDDWRAQTGLIDQLVRFPNIYTDTSGVRRFDILRRALDRAGPSKFLFGSDGPWLHPGVELSKIAALHLPPADARQVLSGNLLRLIGQVRQQLAHKPRVSVAAELATEWRDPWLIGK
ncbi:amidohydrolase family protein [Hymenobacter weizhouensis]|uniref:amidohydrolase family protein n=1 Tax=Hymenobacter sp. YIM 151500-1 TaxID=2987689 RepID=UPI0022269486|nr:amidohydrolase family protein [Hymenobacter sp. YIM 151500-1]UYZ64290.1 amidohydrolase family protein [Hymenobacter sp. YIM 151500-1]